MNALLTIRDVSQLTGRSIDTLKFLALSGGGPAYIEQHGCLFYTVEAVREWQSRGRDAHARLMASYKRTEKAVA